MMPKARHFTALTALLLLSAETLFALTLDNTCRVESRIGQPIPAEQTAELELREYLAQIFGPLQAEKGGTRIILRFDPALAKEEFRIESDGKEELTISGGRPRGVLYGVYWFLDRKLGVHWLTPEFEFVPKYKAKHLPALRHHGRPAFPARILQTEEHGQNTPEGRRWRARNLFNSGFGNIFEMDPAYGEELIFAPPAQCHGLHKIISPARYFKTHPEFWALQNGKRTHRDSRGVTADYCLSNRELIRTTARECREILKKNPAARYLSIQEGDFTRGFCECQSCRALTAEHGNCESARWVYFANQVARELKGEFPDAKLLIFAYAASKKPPTGIKADENVCVQLCAWGNHRGQPYASKKNRSGAELLKQLTKWKKVCRNILIWDYTYSFGNLLLQSPDLLLNIDNFRTFRDYGVDGIFPENGIPTFLAFGMPFKAWLLPRAMWNPDECGNGEELEQAFCREYYGTESGKSIAAYYKLLRDVNRKQGFASFTGAGVIGSGADFESVPVTLRAWKLVNGAMEKAESAAYAERVRTVMLPLQYQILRNYAELSATGKIRKSFEELSAEMIAFLEKHGTSPREKAEYDKMIRNIRKLNGIKTIHASASHLYGNYLPAFAYDGDLSTYWHSACSGSAWIQREFSEERTIHRIVSVFCKSRYAVTTAYSIQGSRDGKIWFDLVPRKEIRRNPERFWLYADDTLSRPVSVKFVRTIRHNALLENGVRNDVMLQEQWFDPDELPTQLKRKGS